MALNPHKETKDTMATQEQWHALAQQLRIDSIRATTQAGSGHPTSSMSAADLMAVLLYQHLRYDFQNPKNPNNDHLIFSKGHAAPLLYAIYKAAGAISDQQMLTLRKFGSPVEGHPVPTLPWVEVATGSLGQGLPIAVGLGIAGKYLDKLPYHMWVLLGDSEMAEGSVYEALELAAHYKLNNVIGILDMNRLGQRGPTMLQWNAPAYAARARSFGWHAIEIDGHDVAQIDRAYAEALQQTEQPTLIIARTIKGKGFSEIEDKENWHGKALPPDMAQRAIAELGGEHDITVQVQRPPQAVPAPQPAPQPPQLPTYSQPIATRQAFGEALRALGAAYPDVVVVDGEVGNSTYTDIFANAYPDRFFEQYIAEEQMVAAAVGLQIRDYQPFGATFAAFFTRAFDFVRMAAISRANIKLAGSHAGVSIGEDGPSQMGLEDLAMMRAVYGSIVLYPSDGNAAAKLVKGMYDYKGISYMRTTREKTPIVYAPDEQFVVGGSKVLRQSASDKVTVVAVGITLHEALKAYERLQGEGIAVRVIDAYSVKPIDAATLHEAARATNGLIVTVEDHWLEGGLGDAVLDAFAGIEGQTPQGGAPRVVKLGVHGMPGSGKPDELLHWAGIDADAIVKTVKELLG
jgi:transketolase